MLHVLMSVPKCVKYVAGDPGQSEAHQQPEACRRRWGSDLRPEVPLCGSSTCQEQDCQDGAVPHLQPYQVWQAACQGLHPHVPAHGLHQRCPALLLHHMCTTCTMKHATRVTRQVLSSFRHVSYAMCNIQLRKAQQCSSSSALGVVMSALKWHHPMQQGQHLATACFVMPASETLCAFPCCRQYRQKLCCDGNRLGWIMLYQHIPHAECLPCCS